MLILTLMYSMSQLSNHLNSRRFLTTNTFRIIFQLRKKSKPVLIFSHHANSQSSKQCTTEKMKAVHHANLHRHSLALSKRTKLVVLLIMMTINLHHLRINQRIYQICQLKPTVKHLSSKMINLQIACSKMKMSLSNKSSSRNPRARWVHANFSRLISLVILQS